MNFSCLQKIRNKLLFLLVSSLIVSMPVATQAQPLGVFFTKVQEANINTNSTRYIVPQQYQTYQLNIADLEAYLAAAPLEFTPAATNPLLLSLPMPNGQTEIFRIWESPIMMEGLANKFPAIKTYKGQGTVNRTATVRFDITPHGFHAMVLSCNGTVYIDPYAKGNTNFYIGYYKKDYAPNSLNPIEFSCTVDEDNKSSHQPRTHEHHHGTSAINNRSSFASDGNLRVYRAAVAATGEFTSFHGGTVADGIAAIITTLNRVNEVYERDLSIRMVLIDNNDEIVYTNGGSDPFNNNNAGALIGQSQSVIDDIIGSANYDIGHTVSTGGGGLASLGVPCINGSKARGITGLSSPIGDPFDIDYVAHEIGHQFGGSHTFNGQAGSCGSNRSASSAYEPGSGTTIQAYAGICGADNTQNNSDDYFHVRSLDQMLNYATEGSGNSCPELIVTGNTAPTSDAGEDYVIPLSTPFILTGEATDAEGDALTYCWEQFDLGPQGSPNAPSGNAPIFRSFDPVLDNFRTFPQLSDLINNTQTIGEILPTYARTMNFRLIVRDNNAAGGCIATDGMQVDVAGSAGPFLVTNPNASLTWTAGSLENVSWDVANTDEAPVNCVNVDILLSIDGGITYPYTLASAVPNSGTATVSVPVDAMTSQARVKVFCSDNIFFDISNANFTIDEPSSPTFVLSPVNDNISVCAPDNASFEFNVIGLAGFSSTVSFSVSGLPSGTSSSFTPSNVVPTATTNLIITNTAAATTGSYNISVTATGGGITQTANVQLQVFEGLPNNISLNTPLNGQTDLELTPTFTWTEDAASQSYDIQIASDVDFLSIIDEGNNLLGNSYTTATALNESTTYYWRVRGVNDCEAGDYATIYSFTTNTIVCETFESTDVPISISPNDVQTEFSDLPIDVAGEILDVNVVSLDISHTWIADMNISLFSPSGTEVDLVGGICGNDNDMNLGFDDDAASSNIPCPPTDGNTYQPSGSLADFNGEEIGGNWVLRLFDDFDEDGGSLNAWSLEICYLPPPPPASFSSVVTPIANDVCSGDPASFSITINAIGPFTETVNLNAVNLPAGVSFNFSPANVVSSGSSTLTILNTENAAPGTYNFDIEVNGGGISQILNTSVTINDATLAIPELQMPSNAATDVVLNPSFSWTTIPNADTYNYQLANDPEFSSIVVNVSGITALNYTLTSDLSTATTYYWRVQGVGICDTGGFSTPFSFSTSNPPVNVNIRAILQGAFTGSSMSTDLRNNNLIPLNQPYSTTPWNYSGSESVANANDFPADMVDWVLLEFRLGSEIGSIVEQKAAILLSDGSIIDANGDIVSVFNLIEGENYYVIVRHRNHLAVLSAIPVTVNGFELNYDFTTSVSQALGDNQQVDSGTVAVMYAADINADGVITVNDFNIYLDESSGVNAYSSADCNLDRNVTATDFNFYSPNSSLIGVVEIRY